MESGELDVKHAKLGLKNSHKVRTLMGLCGPQTDNECKHIKTEEVGSEGSQAKSLLAAKKGMVLLKRGPLPFKKGTKVAVVGQSVNSAGGLTRNCDSPLCPKGGSSCWPSLGQAINASNVGGTTVVVASTDAAAATTAATAAEFVVCALDNARDGGGEGQDRMTIWLSADQIALANAVIAANKDTVLALINGGTTSIDELANSAPAIIEAFMPGAHGSTAIASAVFGDNNPGGKRWLPVTMCHSNCINETKFLLTDMDDGVGRSHKCHTATRCTPSDSASRSPRSV